MTKQSVYSVKLDDTQISAESRSLHCNIARLLREMLSFIYGQGIPCYANIADLEVCTGGPAAQFVGLVVSKRRYKSLLVNRTLAELKQKCA